MPIFDTTKLATPALQNAIMLMIRIHGIDADLYKLKEQQDSDYAKIYPETVPDGSFLKTIRVLPSETLQGPSLSDFISIIGHIDDEKWVISLDPLSEGQKLDLKYPDGKTLTVRVKNSESIHGATTFDYKYYVEVM